MTPSFNEFRFRRLKIETLSVDTERLFLLPSESRIDAGEDNKSHGFTLVTVSACDRVTQSLH